jgi:hypothetical protein
VKRGVSGAVDTLMQVSETIPFCENPNKEVGRVSVQPGGPLVRQTRQDKTDEQQTGDRREIEIEAQQSDLVVAAGQKPGEDAEWSSAKV